MNGGRSTVDILQSRASLVVCCVLVFLLIIIGLCGSNTVPCLLVFSTDGMVAAGWIFGAFALGSIVMRFFRIEARSGLLVATAAGLGLGIFSLLGLGLGLAGWLNRPVAIALPVISVAIFVVSRVELRGIRKGTIVASDGFERKSSPSGRPQRGTVSLDYFSESRSRTIMVWLSQPAGCSWLWIIPVASLAIAAVSASLMPGLLWKPLDPHPYDVTSYHLLVPREWYEGGRIVPLAHNVFSYFPFNVEMQFLLLMHATGGPWAAMYVCQFVCVGYSALMVMAIWGEVPKVSEDSASANFSRLMGAAIVAVVPWVIMLAGVAYVESALMLYTVLAVTWAIRACGRGSPFARCMVVSGLMAGLACGVKITAVPMLLLPLPIAVLCAWRSIDLPLRRIVIGCFALVAVGSVVLSPWLIRNFAWCRNPLFPVAMKELGQDHFSDLQVKRFITAHSPLPTNFGLIARTRVLWTDVIAHWEYGFIVLPLGLVAILWGYRDRQTWMISIVGLFVLITYFGFTHLIPRFFVMIIPLCGMAIARLQLGRAWPIGLLLLLLAAGTGWGTVMPTLSGWSNPAPMNGQPTPALMGYTELSGLMPPELIDARDRHLQVALIGDAQAFLIQLPMSQLHYRSVFNVATDTDDAVNAWIGPKVLGDPHWLLMINTTEISRLHRTYVAIPDLPEDWRSHYPQTYFLTGDQLTRHDK